MKCLLACCALAVGLAAQLSAASFPSIGTIGTPYPPLQSSVRIAGTAYAAGTVAYGPVGTPLVISGSNFSAGVTVNFSGPQKGATVSLAATSWTSTSIVVVVPNGATTGSVTVTVNGQTSNAAPFVVTSGAYSASCPHPQAPAVTLASSANPSTYGNSVTFTTVVTTGATGTVTFKDGGNALGTGTISSGTATYTTTALGSGSHSVSAVYSGDTNYSPWTSAPLTETVNTAPSAVGLNSSANPSAYASSVTFTATVSGGGNGETITFYDGSSRIGIGTLNNSGATTLVISTLALGSHIVTASYPGDSNLYSSTSSALAQVVNKAAPSVSISSSALQSAYGSPVTFTATVLTGATGTVTFMDGSTTLGVGTISSGLATYTTSTLTAGYHSITGVYSGDTDFAGASSSAVSEGVMGIAGISPPSAPVGALVGISGLGFGAEQGTSTVAVNGVSAFVTFWSDANVTFLVPAGATSGPVMVNIVGVGSSQVNFTVTAATSCIIASAPGAGSPAYVSTLTYVETGIIDGLGRPIKSQLTSDPDGITYTDTTYDALGRKASVTNPYRSASDATYGTTQYSYDPLGRVTTVIEADGSKVSTDYSQFPCTTVTDEAGKQRKSCVDGLGRIIGVWEDPAGGNYETDYQYQGNLISVVQKGNSPSNSANWRPRNFIYDSLSRLTNAYNPESGNISYTYDGDGNVVNKIAANGTTTFSYDNLNRLIQKSYDDGRTATVRFAYDGNSSTLGGCSISPPALADSYPIGRRTAMCDASGATGWSHDQMGRITGVKRMVSSGQPANPAFTVSYRYNYLGSPLSIAYPSGLLVNYSYNQAGRPTSVSKTDTNSGQVLAYVSGATYTPFGSLAQEVLGNASPGCFGGVNGYFSYNNRLQPFHMLYTANANSSSALIAVASNSCQNNTGDLLHRMYSFFDGSGNNGNVGKITNCLDDNRNQNFAYDSLNRIQFAWTDGANWGEQFTIDPWGNLTNIASYGQKSTSESLNNSVNTNNQLGGIQYDGAGNQQSSIDAFGVPHSYAYDAENRISSVDGGAVAYAYDGDGGRAFKNVGGAGTIYWSGAGPDTLAETDLSGNVTAEYIYFGGRRIARVDNPVSPTEASLKYYLADHVGSTSMVTSGDFTTVLADTDYYPYGREVVPNGADSNHYKFTGKERDAETGLDYFGARYYGSNMGRFMSPDWSAQVEPVPFAKLDNPQSMNLYSYVGNNPLSRRDPDGHRNIAAECNGQATCQKTVVDTVNIAHYDKKTGKTVVDSTLKVTTNFNLTTDAKGNVNVSASSTVENVSGHQYSSGELSTMGKDIGAIQQSAVMMGFGANTTQMMTAVGAAETVFGTARASESSPFKASAINPLQLSGGRANGDLMHNVQGALNVFDYFGRKVDFDPIQTYGGYSDGSVPTMANFMLTYNSVTENPK